MAVIRCVVVADRTTNRAAFPLTAYAVDMFTAAFGPVRVRYIEEGGRTMGRPDAPGPDDALTGRELSDRYDRARGDPV